MVIGLKINQSGETELIDYTDNFNTFITKRGVGEISCFFTIEADDNKTYLFYGYTLGYNNFNKFEFPTHNVYGDAFILAIQGTKFVDVDMEIVNGFFTEEDLNDNLFMDEFEDLMDDDSGSDLLDFIDYNSD